MAIKLIPMKCPSCGAELSVEEDRKQIFCSFCGCKIIINNENEYTYRMIDEAGIKQAEVNRDVQMKKYEIYEKNRVEKEKRNKIKFFISILLGIVMLISFGLGYKLELGTSGLLVSALTLMFMWGNNSDNDCETGDNLKIPSGISDYANKNYTAIETILKDAGFTNIKCIPLNDLTTGLLKKPGMVESITINGQAISYAKKYSKDSSIIIMFHSFAEKR